MANLGHEDVGSQKEEERKRIKKKKKKKRAEKEGTQVSVAGSESFLDHPTRPVGIYSTVFSGCLHRGLDPELPWAHRARRVQCQELHLV